MGEDHVISQSPDLTRTHLIGVGGAGMSAIATLLVDRGGQVSGSDAKDSRTLAALAARGVRTAVGQRVDNLDLLPDGPTTVVTSTAIRADNVELVEAQRRGLPVIRRADALAALMAGSRTVCVAGTHGKTSTTSLLTVALQHAGVDPSFAIGGQLNDSGAGAHAGTGDIFVAEADESDGSFLAFTPFGAIITTIEADHLDFHRTEDAYRAVFDRFVGRILPGGFLVAGVDDPGVRRMLDRLVPTAPPIRVVTYGRDPAAEVRIESVTTTADGSRAAVRLPDGTLVTLMLAVPGHHMVSNAVAALATGWLLGVGVAHLLAGLAGFSGVRRRFELRGVVDGLRVVDDYAHHPTEVAATLGAARQVVGAGRLVVVFQPHLYSRTVAFAERFGAALAAADIVIVLDVFGAREGPQVGVTGALVADAVPLGVETHYEPSQARVAGLVARLARPGDLVLTMGAGDVTMLGPEILAAWASRGDGAAVHREEV